MANCRQSLPLVPHLPDRRRFLSDVGLGFTGLVLGTLLFEDGIVRAGVDPSNPSSSCAKAKSVIWLFMMGGVSHLESFDPKPALNKYAGKKISETPFEGVLKLPDVNKNFRPFNGEPKLDTRILPLQVGYRKRGESGIEISDWWPHVGECIDDLAVVRSLWTTDFNHSAQLQFNTGRILLDGREPSLGSWAHYGLGTLNENLPKFVVLGRPPSDFGGGVASHTASYLGPEHDGVPLDVDPARALPFLPRKSDGYRAAQKKELALLQRLNKLSAVEYPNDPNLRARIKSYELAFRMQTSMPEVVNLQAETQETKRLYGLDRPETCSFGKQCLVARRLVERGVRFVQVYHGGAADNDNGRWDSHQDMREHAGLCKEVDLPIAGLLKDLKRRGLLDSTLVVWATEFGRAPNIDLRTPGPKDPNARNGRDHHIYGFSVWLAGGGVKGGVVHGKTDELGFHAVENRHYVTDIHATVLHQLGLNPRQLEIPGRRRLEIDIGRPIHEILA
jgi:hypothetical protein